MENETIEYVNKIKNNKNDSEAWDFLFLKYRNYLLKIISRYIFDSNNREDVLQETWIRVFKLIDRYNDQYKFSIWLMLNTINICKNWLIINKRNNSKSHLSMDEYFENIETSVSGKFEEDLAKRDILEKALTHIKNDHDKLAFQLKFINQLTLKEISQIMNEKESVIKNWIYRTREKITQYIKNNSYD